VKVAELAIAAPQVIALRTARMLAAGAHPHARDRREFMRMGTEKVQVFWESMRAISEQMYKTNQEWTFLAMRRWSAAWMSPWSLLTNWAVPLRGLGSSATQKRLQNSTSKMIEKGLTPVHKRAAANARRLSRMKKR
jgi:hypothetical protein